MYNPIQTNQMPFKSKVRNMAWKALNKSLFRFTPPILLSFENIVYY